MTFNQTHFTYWDEMDQKKVRDFKTHCGTIITSKGHLLLLSYSGVLIIPYKELL